MKFLENVEHILYYEENQVWSNEGISVEYFDQEWVVSYKTTEIPCESKEEAFSTAERLMVLEANKKANNKRNIVRAASIIVTVKASFSSRMAR